MVEFGAMAAPEPGGGDPACWLKDFPSDTSASPSIVVDLSAMQATGTGPLWRLRDPSTIAAELFELPPDTATTPTTVPYGGEQLLLHQDGAGHIRIDGQRQPFGPNGLARIGPSQTWTMSAGPSGLRWLIVQAR